MRNKKGFTLIELLVVIAIIGILAGIVLISIRGVRNQAYDAEIKSEISQIRTEAEMYYQQNDGSYSGFVVPANIQSPPCANNTDNKYLLDISSTGQSIAIYSKLCTDNTKWWCVDSDGKTGIVNTDPLATQDGLCP